MGKVKELNIKNQSYYFFNDMTNIKNFHSNLLKIDKKPHKDVDIYYTGYITIKNIGDYENIHSVNRFILLLDILKKKNLKNHSFCDRGI